MPRTFAAWAEANRPDARNSRSTDGALAVTMRWTACGLFVERVVQRPKAARIVQATVFDTPGAFRRWCDADPARFEHPLLYLKLTRDAGQLFAEHANAQATG